MKEFDVNKLVYKPPKQNTRGGKNVGITLDNHKVILQFPLVFTWGANELKDKDTDKPISYSVSLQLNKEGNVNKFYESMKAFENKIIADAVKNCKQWFGKSKMTEDVVRALFYPILKYPMNKQTEEPDYTRNPTLKLKIPYWDEKFTIELYDMDRKSLYNSEMTDISPLNIIPTGSHLVGLMECGGVWFAAGRFGVTWKLLQAKVRQPLKIKGFCILDDSDDEEALEEISKKENEEVMNNNNVVMDSEDEDEDEIVSEPPPKIEEPAPVKVVKKKKIVKKKTVAAAAA